MRDPREGPTKQVTQTKFVISLTNAAGTPKAHTNSAGKSTHRSTGMSNLLIIKTCPVNCKNQWTNT